MQRMAWLLSQHVLVYRIDSHTNHLPDGRGTDAGSTACGPVVVEADLEVTLR